MAEDIIIFLMVDILVLVPLWFAGRYFVGRTLTPVEENMITMDHFVHDAGHELKTPLAIVSGNLQILREGKNKDIDLLEKSILTLHSMSESIDSLTDLSSLKLPTTIKNTSLKK